MTVFGTLDPAVPEVHILLDFLIILGNKSPLSFYFPLLMSVEVELGSLVLKRVLTNPRINIERAGMEPCGPAVGTSVWADDSP